MNSEDTARRNELLERLITEEDERVDTITTAAAAETAK